MIPQRPPMIARVHLRYGRGRNWRIWFPLFLVWLLLLPLLLILLPFFLVACLVTWINPIQAMGIFADILGALRGTHIEVDDRHARIEISLI